MRYDNLLVEFATTPAYVFVAFVVFLLLFHVFMVKFRNHDDIFWKRVDYVWLGAAALGILSASAQLNHTVAQSYIENSEAARTVSMYGLLRHFLDGPFWVCLPRNRTEFSPPDFDAIIKEQQELCQQGIELARRLPSKLPDDYPSLESMGYTRIGENAKYEPDFGKMIETGAQMYRDQRDRYKGFVAASKPSSWEVIVNTFGPLLLAFALALRITKVSGEIKNAKAKLAAELLAHAARQQHGV